MEETLANFCSVLGQEIQAGFSYNGVREGRKNGMKKTVINKPK